MDSDSHLISQLIHTWFQDVYIQAWLFWLDGVRQGPQAGSLSSAMFSLQLTAVSLGNLTTCPNSPRWTVVPVSSEAAHCGWRSLWLRVWPQSPPCPARVEHLSRVGARLENCPWLKWGRFRVPSPAEVPENPLLFSLKFPFLLPSKHSSPSAKLQGRKPQQQQTIVLSQNSYLIWTRMGPVKN